MCFVRGGTEGDNLAVHGAIHLGIAVDLERDGLAVPVVRDAGPQSVPELARAVRAAATGARAGTLRPDDYAGGTYTISNSGSFDTLFTAPIINQPQVAILGTGAIVKRPVVIDDPNLGETIAVRHMMYLALTYDHRLVDGADAARFLTDVKERLEAGQFEV